MPESLVVPDPNRPAPAPLAPADCRRAAERRWSAARFPTPPPSVLLTVWVPAENLVVDLHPNGVALTVDHPDQPDTVARWWADVLGAEVWLTDVSGVGYAAFTPTS